MIEDKQRFANKKFDEIVVEGFQLFARNYIILIFPMALFLITSIILQIFLLSDLKWNEAVLYSQVSPIIDKISTDYNYIPSDAELNLVINWFSLYILELLLSMLINFFFIILAMCSVSSYCYKTYLNEEVNFIEEFKNSFNSKIFFVILIMVIFLSLGFIPLLLFIPGIIIFGFYIFSVFTYNMEEIDNPISEARSISRGSFGRIIGMLIICSLLLMFIEFIYQLILDLMWNNNSLYISWINPSTRNYGMLILYDLLYQLIEIIFAPLFICLLTPLFVSCKARKELGYQYQKTRNVSWGTQYDRYAPQDQGYSRTIQDQPEPSIKSPESKKEGFYCPFCGFLNKVPKKYCPNCGEALDFKI